MRVVAGGPSGAHSVKPVFYDASRRRWLGFATTSGLLTLFVVGILGLLALSIADTPTIRAVPLAQPGAVAIATISPVPDLSQTMDIVADPMELASIASPSRPVEAVAMPPVLPAANAGPDTVAPSPEATLAMAGVPLPRPRPQLAPAPRTEVVAAVAVRTRPAPARTVIDSPSFVTLGSGSSVAVHVPRDSSGGSITHLPPASRQVSFTMILDQVLGGLLSVLAPPVNAQEFTADAPAPEIQAFFVNWDHSSASSLHQFIRNIDVLVPDWITLRDDAGNLAFDMGQRTLQTLALRADTHPDLRVMPLFTNYAGGQWQVERLRAVMASPGLSRHFADQIVTYLTENGFDGLTLRFSGLSSDDRASHRRFLEVLSPILADNGLRLQHVVNIEGGALDPVLFADLVDIVIVEAHGQTVATDAPGPLAGQDWFADLAAQWTTRIAPEKLVFSLASLAYDWPETGPAEQISMLEAYRRAERAGAEVSVDPASLNSSFTYNSADGASRSVWMLDGVAAFNQARALSGTGIAGLALNRLGTEDASVWQVLSNPYAGSASALEAIDYAYQIARNGSGEIIKLVGLPATGSRSVTLGEDGFVTAAAITTFPKAYEIDHWGSTDSRLVALTFDDGPDPAFTPQVLDILARYDVPATFFAVGAQMLRHPDIVRRMVAEGHEIGSHTYSHVNISTMSPEMLRLDLNATQRVFESITGRHMAMFRAPYAVDANPRTPSEIAPLATVGALGYVTVNMNIDPLDWWLPSAGRIAKDTIEGIESGLGNVVLLHDGGGDRQHTVDALPEIIETLQARGYSFVAISDLVGLSAEEMMPVSSSAEGPFAAIQNVGFTLLREGEKLMVGLFALAIGLGIARSVLLILLSAFRRPHARLPSARAGLRFGVIVPAYNEEKVVLKTVRSLLQSDYSDLKVLVVDDGSKDNTFALCRDTFADEPRVEVVTKPNGGKAAALNYGFERLDVDVVVALDADTIFLPDTISRLADHFHDERVVAVAGNAKVGNRLNLLTRWQAIEYITAQNLDRRAFDLLNCITVVPGAVGAWWRDTVIELGGYSTDTLAEDADLTIRILRAGYKVTYEEGALAYTEAPETTRQLFKQRFRWMFGMLQVTQKHRGALAMKDSIPFALFGLPNILLFQIIFPLLAPFADLVALLTLAGLGVQMVTGSNLLGFSEAMIFLGLFGAFILLDFAAAAIAFWHEKKEDWRLLIWLLPQRFYYRQLLYIVAIKAALTAIRGSMVGWGNLDRSASVPALGQKAGQSAIR